MSLDPRPARPLTSREIAKLIAALLGSLCGAWCDPKEVMAALDHFAEHRDSYEAQFRQMAALLPPDPST